MNWKKLIIAFIVVFVVFQILGFVVHQVLLGETYQELEDVWRSEADMMSKMWVMWVTGLIFSFFFVYIFARGYEGKGIMEGVRYGLIIGCFYTIPAVYGQYVVYELPYSLILQWVIYDFIILVITGAVMTFVYKPAEVKAKAA